MGTIGDLERQAGIGPTREERAAFWLRFRHLDGRACLEAGVAELHRIIAEKAELDRHSGRDGQAEHR
ncbi:hypothetical protein [Ochrobactrum sp. MC-1LL]|uniref:hypothetical protein n=1 Tax=Ochrobactrum sp. MC-1LL TaxID=2735351 RepID=UPI000E5B9DC3|nr:hypothetical protein [Ochrobactrum sp. MC-1LL]KAB2681027.1 hypothetical protein F9K78_15645 [Brucella pseudintermedia]NKE75289.1 hypothetical protein [Ochrobactrum sp. MC-1LL]